MIAYIIITAVLIVASMLFAVYMLTRGRAAWTPGEQTTTGGKIRDTLKNVL